MSINARSVGAISRRFFFLDYLRVCAFVTVLIGHKFYSKIEAFSKDETVHATSRLFASCVEAIVKGGGTGVVVFFLVSGYIITHVLQKEDTVEFVIKRLFRIYPLFVAAVLIEYALDLHHGVPRGKWNLLMQLSLMGDFTTTPGVLNSVDWTLRIEVLFYLFMAVLSALKIVRGDGRVLACVFLTATVALGQFGPFPREKVWSVGYLNIYGPFLFLGAMLYYRLWVCKPDGTFELTSTGQQARRFHKQEAA
ncbi:acyltransferase family protein [Ralstonia mannitolilytica]